MKLFENLNSPYISKYYTSFRENENFYIITEYMHNGSLSDLIKKNIEKNRNISEKKYGIT